MAEPLKLFAIHYTVPMVVFLEADSREEAEAELADSYASDPEGLIEDSEPVTEDTTEGVISIHATPEILASREATEAESAEREPVGEGDEGEEADEEGEGDGE